MGLNHSYCITNAKSYKFHYENDRNIEPVYAFVESLKKRTETVRCTCIVGTETFFVVMRS